MNQYARLIIVLAILLGISGTFLLYLAWPSLTGQTIVLALRPVDPFDPFRGQYITLNYEINAIPSVDGAKESDAVYISLKEDENKIWRYESASLEKPQRGIFIKGTIKSIYGGTTRVEYGIEQFFFERHAEFPQRDLTVEVKVSSSGQARISQLLHEGNPINITYRKPSLTS
ncbi:GDYXXLXY domain-containing protein [Candidatus Woesearchaeota archaeon]|nr:GDYXXLXY domain-containing protein [Candidatus Woesearchaeota archaeon]